MGTTGCTWEKPRIPTLERVYRLLGNARYTASSVHIRRFRHFHPNGILRPLQADLQNPLKRALERP